jgi:L-amino acid N-acyltransferase YncA
MNKEIKIRLATKKDADGVWKIFKTVVATGDTYVNGPKTTKKQGCDKWFAKDRDMKTYVALINNKIVGAYFLRNNHPDLGSHTSNAGFIVDKNTRGMGVGKALISHALNNAKKLGYLAMQFNFVVSTNTTALNLWNYRHCA